MKLFKWVTRLLASGILFCSLFASASTDSDPAVLLLKMSEAVQKRNYELTFINANRTGYEVVRYRHAFADNKAVAQMIYMEGPVREVLLRGNLIAYFQQETQPFSLQGERIVDALPAIFYANYTDLNKYYNFIAAGRARTANRSCLLIRIIDKDNARYSQVIWIDENTYLPLRVDYLDREGEVIEQFKVASLVVSTEIANSMKSIDEVNFPPLLPVNNSRNSDLPMSWSVKWLPEGFKEVSRSHNELGQRDVIVESRLFSDGIFTFTINVLPNEDNVRGKFINKGARLVHSEILSDNEVIIIGELPLTTAKRIIASINFMQ